MWLRRLAGVAAGILALSVAAAGPVGAVDMDDDTRVWVKGETYRQTAEGCASKGVKSPLLQFRVDGKWITVARGKLVPVKRCAGSKEFRYAVTFTFTVRHVGVPIPGERETLLEVRHTWNANGKAWKDTFSKYVYRSSADHEADLLDCLFDPYEC